MNILLGANGQVGSAIQIFAQEKNIAIHAFSRQQLDLTNLQPLSEILKTTQAKFLINAAAYTAVDLAETEKDQAMQLNAYALEQLAKICAEHNCVLIHLSTDYVFDGKSDRAYIEHDPTGPLSVYGQGKLLGENLIAQTWKKHIILRVSWVFGQHGKNFVKTILRLAQTQQQLNIVADQKGCPTAAAHIAAVIFQVIKQIEQGNKQYGIYHYCDQPLTTWYDFACAIVACAKPYFALQVQQINPITTAEFPTPAIRPNNSELNCEKIERVFAVKRYYWQEELQKIIAVMAENVN